MFEHRHQPLLPRHQFVRRLLRSAAVAAVMVLFSLLVGMAGYHFIAGFDWIDSFLNASMILSGMGEIHELTTTSAKIFAGVYAMFSGIAFLATWTILLAPLAHRVMHHFHWESESRNRSQRKGKNDLE